MQHKIAVLLTCFNRRSITLQCLGRLFQLTKDIDVYLVDDGSTDGTAEEVSKLYPTVIIINGTGDLFWNRGMQLAWITAAKQEYDFYILLNDDVVLYKDSFDEIFACSALVDDTAIISGIIESANKSEILYGGSDSKKHLIEPNGTLQDIYFMNGNFVLIPKSVYEVLGTLDPYYHHDLGDVDYGLMARKHNIKVYTTRKPIGIGGKNEYCRVRKWNSTIANRFKKLYLPLGSPPSINFYFRKKHFGYLNAVYYYCFQHFINILPDPIIVVMYGEKYKDKI